MRDSSPLELQHLVVPGQIIAVATDANDSFLRGHGTYMETTDTGETRLVASVTGLVTRVNKLISVQALADSVYQGHVGDLIVGRVVAVQNTRWKVEVTSNSRHASLPLSAVHLPGGVQRIRTAADARDMRHFLQEGDLVSAEIHKVQTDQSLLLHTRSVKYGKLENGIMVEVPPQLIPRRKNHYMTVLDQFDVLWGCNGRIWLQRKMEDAGDTGGPELVELQEERRQQHASTPMTTQERRNMARLRNSIECLKLVHCTISVESVEEIYRHSEKSGIPPSQMVLADNVITLTASTRQRDA